MASIGGGHYGLSGRIPARAVPDRQGRRLPIGRTGALASVDVIALALCFGAAFAIAPSAQALMPGLAAECVGVFGYFAYRGHYQRRNPFWTELRQLAAASLVALVFGASLALASPQPHLAGVAVAFWLAFPLLTLFLRARVRRVLAKAGIGQLRTVVVGHAPATATTVAALQSEPWLGYDVAGVVTLEEVERFPSKHRWRTVMDIYGAGLTILSLDSGQSIDRDLVASLVRDRVPFAIVPQADGLPVLGYEQTQFFSHDTVIVSYRNNLAQPMARAIKVAFDLCAAAVGLLLAAPVFLVVALLVKLDGGPAFFGHTRLGAGARPFRCLKFRSMVVDSDERLVRHLARDPAAAEEWLKTRKLRNDPRITRIGRFLRTTSLDELPQLLNVLRLEMSLVGPRPIVRAEMRHYGEDIAYYFETRPGLTGLWQVSGRTGTTFERRVELDCWYVKNWTLWHDLAILTKTVPAVLKRRGAV